MLSSVLSIPVAFRGRCTMDFTLWQTFCIYLSCHFSFFAMAAGMSQTHFPIQENVDTRSKFAYSDLLRREIISSLMTGRRPKTDGEFHRALGDLLLRNMSNPMADTDLALTVSSLIARGDSLTQKGINLVADLRYRVDRKSTPRPYLVLTLCNAHAVEHRHLNKMLKLASKGSKYLDTRELETDCQILKALACAASLPNALEKNLEFHEYMVETAKKIAQTNSVGNVGTTSLIVQALTAYNIVVDDTLEWQEQEKLNFLRKESDTPSLTKIYYITLGLNSRRVPFLKSLHPQIRGSQIALRRVINVTLALRLEGTPEMDFAVQMKVPAGWNLHEIILRASNVTSRFQLVYSENLRKEKMIIELDGIPNDPERATYWMFAIGNGSTSCSTSYIPSDGETITFLYGETLSTDAVF